MSREVPFPGLELEGTSLVIVRVPQHPTVEYIRECYAAMHQLLDKHEAPYAFVIDCTKLAEMPSARVRGAIAEEERLFHPLDERWNVGHATVLTSPLARGAVTAIHWIAPPPYPHTICATTDEALRWARERLEKADAARSAKA